jgi:aspartokinase/homoserine dehydrogenase 1
VHVIVMKFGGTSVGTRARLAQVARLVAGREGSVVVVSAMGGTTDVLLQAGVAAERGEGAAAQAAVAVIRDRHLAAVDDPEIHARVELLTAELSDLLRGVALLGEQTPRSRAMLASFGERLSVHIVAAHLCAGGVAAVAVDARELVVTDDTFEEGVVDVEASRSRVRARLLPLVEQGKTPVVTGFLGATPEGRTTVLGRGGSDYTGALLGSMLDAEEIWIWTDVNGIFTADPRLVRDARTLTRVSFREAAEMSYFGAKVVHPKTMLPAMEGGIPIRIRSTLDPELLGTLIAEDAPSAVDGVKTVTAIQSQVLVTIEGRGMAGIPGMARRIFGCTERARVNVVMISQASSEQTVSVVVAGGDAAQLERELQVQFELEIAAGLLDPIVMNRGVAVVSIIGQGMTGRSGVSASLFGALGKTGVNVLAIAQGAAELSISVAVADEDAGRAVRAVHAAFGLRRILDVVVIGVGRVGQALLEMIAQSREEVAESRNVEIRLLAVARSTRFLLDRDGLDPREAAKQLQTAGERPSDEELLRLIDEARSGDVVLVDVTAADAVEFHEAALQAGVHIVTANKKPLSGSLASYRGLVDAVRRTGATYGYETTFGAGLPVLHTLKELLHTGDRLHSVSGCFSGTLGFVCTRLQEGGDLAEIVEEAAALGYTEPDPREDLSGRDVARKALIVARAMGLDLEPADVSLEPVVPGMEAGLAEALANYAPILAARVQEAAGRGAVLRYVAEITTKGARVGLQEVSASSPIGALAGPDNILVFRTERYKDYPLVIQGPGAGASVTAAGVLGDILRVAAST